MPLLCPSHVYVSLEMKEEENLPLVPQQKRKGDEGNSSWLLSHTPSVSCSSAYTKRMCSRRSCHDHHSSCHGSRYGSPCHESRPSCNITVVERPCVQPWCPVQQYCPVQRYCPPTCCYPRYQYSQCCKFPPQFPKCPPQYPK